MAHSLYHSSVHPFPSMVRPTAARSTAGRPTSGLARHSEPNFVIRRVVAAVLMIVTLMVAVGVLVLLAGVGGRPASASRAEPAISPIAAVHVAEPGESLWTIAQAHHGDVGFDRYVDALIDLNGGTDVQIGQAVRLP